MTQIKHTQICRLAPGQYQPYRNKHTQICTLLLGMDCRLTYSNRYGAVWVWSSLREKQWIHTGDPVEIAGLPSEKGVSSTGKGAVPLREKGGEKATQNLVHV